ncbi:hypothetical protein [Bacillus suaedaesalsae]|uniref:PepSY domain-containing protein n=1 Tax=Bacillus suaedaesalsae TaxID=2810349 RepID=A0ABS2DJY4_9BACI|nr:hypothetical protein [Bacillus suaedaesalsae]MBM6618799.1 hypothetical protein [Bacillus suaedaesalsae]
MMKKKGLLIVLVLIFLTACTFIQKDNSKVPVEDTETLLMNDLDTIVKNAQEFANLSESTEVQEVFQNEVDRIWKVQFSNGTIVLYDENTDEFVHAE